MLGNVWSVEESIRNGLTTRTMRVLEMLELRAEKKRKGLTGPCQYPCQPGLIQEKARGLDIDRFKGGMTTQTDCVKYGNNVTPYQLCFIENTKWQNAFIRF